MLIASFTLPDNGKGGTGARNILEGIIEEISEKPSYISLKTDAGPPFTVYLTRNALEDLNLTVGRRGLPSL